MKRFWIVVAVSLAMLLALLGVRDFDSSREPSDEILAYEVSDESSVTVTLSGGIERVLINTWLLVPIDARDPLFPYGIEMVVSNLEGEIVATRRFETRSRLSDIEGNLTAEARVADAKAWVCEPRSFELETGALAGQAGLLRVRALPGPHSRVLLRMTHPAARGEWERRILERALGPEEMRRIMAGRSSLGFFDLPVEQRMDALGHWERRLTAQGSEGRDYQSRRLLIGNPSAPRRPERWLEAGVDTSPEQQIALNLSGALALRVHAEVGSAIVLQDGAEGTTTRHVVTEAAGLELQLPDSGLRTVTLYAETQRRVAFSAPTAEGWLWAEPPALVDERFEVLPDIRKRNHYKLDRRSAVVVSVAPSQPWAGFDVRSELPPGVPLRALEFDAQWTDERGLPLARLTYRARAERSSFERLNTLAVTDLATVRLRVPDGAHRLELYGESHLALAPFVPEPEVHVAVRSPPYDLEPPQGQVWRYTPQALSPITGVRPDNLSELRMQGRELVLYEQVRLEPIEGRGNRIVPRVLKPVERTTERALLSWVADAAVGSVATNLAPTWVVLSSAEPESRLRFEAASRTLTGVKDAAAEFEWTLLAPKTALGETWAVSVDGEPLIEQELAFTTARGNQLIVQGEHQVQLQASPGVLLAVRAKPLGGITQGPTPPTAYKQQSVVQVPERSGLTFPFRREPGELLSLVVVLAVQGETAAANAQYAIDRGRPRTHDSFFHRETEPGAIAPITFGQHGRGLIWDADNGGRGKSPDGLARLVIALGDDLEVGHHTLTLNVSGLRGKDRAWVRAVAVGRQIDAARGGEVFSKGLASPPESSKVPNQ
jgi:hypothetical protein